ncbi:MAG: glycosyltransferase [Deltaproteobacteria bacterium]|nr:MAG: glycosyltransferase [Deltaproteobacteria bacterium]
MQQKFQKYQIADFKSGQPEVLKCNIKQEGIYTIKYSSQSSSGEYIDQARRRYQVNRIAHWDRVSDQKEKPRQAARFYHRLIQHYYKFLVPKGLRVLEIGCGHGDLLAALKPSYGIGLDFSRQMIRCAAKKHPDLNFVVADAHDFEIKQKFDVIILSDLVNDLWDLQGVLENLAAVSHPKTRLVVNFYNNLWRIPLSVVKRLGLGANLLEQILFSPHDIFNLLQLAGFEVISHRPCILWPINFPLLVKLANRYLVYFPPFKWFALTNIVVSRPQPVFAISESSDLPSVSVIIPARNESGNIENIFKRLPALGSKTELIFVEGHSDDSTYETIDQVATDFPQTKCKLLRQTGKGKGNAVRLGFKEAEGEVLMILDADMTVPPEDLQRFYEAIVSRKGEFINGVRLVYPLENQAMRFLNILGNKFFSLAFGWLLGQPIKDTLCGTKVLWKADYNLIAHNREYFGEFDPFGDFDLLFGAARLNLKIAELPIRYRSRTYGVTNIDRWRHGWLLLRMVLFAAKRIKFI